MSSGGLSIGELVGTISLNDQFSGPIDKVAKALGVSSESFKAVAGVAGLMAGAVVGATTAIVALGVHGADVADVSSAFDNLSSAAGSTAEAMLGALNEGTLNTISNFDLMKAANGVLASGMVSTAGDMKTLAAGAKLLADRTGGDTTEAFGQLTSAMASGRTAALKQLGVVVDGDSAMQAYATSVHKTVAQLSDHEQATAKSQAVLGALRAALDAAGPASADFGDRINQGKKAITDFTDNVSVAIANSPALAVAMDAISSAIQGAFGGNNQQAVQTISDYVTKFALFLVDAAQVGVDAARFITDAFNGTRLIFNLVLEALFSGIGKAAGVLAELADKAQALPVVGSAFASLAGDIHATADMANSLAIGFKEQGDKAYDSAVASTVAFDAVDAALLKVEGGMQAVAGAQVVVATTGAGVKQAHTDAAAAAQGLADVLAGLAEDNAAFVEAWSAMGTAVNTTFVNLMNDITQLGQTQVEARLTQIEFEHQGVLSKMNEQRALYGEYYDGLVALTDEKYRIMTEQAQGHFASVELAAESAGFKTKAEQQQTADNAKKLWEDMTRSGKFSDGELERAHKAYTDATKAMDNDKALNATQKFDLIAGAASTILRSIFGKSKAAAIAAVIIDVATGVIKSFAQYGWPWGLVPAAAITAQGFAAISKINSTDGSFAEGTPGTSFVDFGRESVIAAHGPEAIVNMQQGATLGEVLAGMVRDALQSGQAEVVEELKRQGEEAANDRKLLPYRLAQAAQLARA